MRVYDPLQLFLGRAFPGRTRALCAYPLIARYRGQENSEDSASFSCEKP
jgi:hypothetical protein